MTLLELKSVLKEAGIPVAHYEIVKTDYPYIIFQEFATTDKWASGQSYEEHIRVEIAHFTKIAFDPSLKKLKDALRKRKIGFTITHGFDPEDKCIINQFLITIVDETEVATN